MPLEQQSQRFLDAINAANAPPMYTLSAGEARRDAAAMFGAGDADDGRVPPVDSEDRMIPSDGGRMRCRIYHPGGKEPLPILVYYHGGGWVLEGVEPCDAFCKFVAALANAVVVSAEYRLSPECKYPGALNDAYTAAVWVCENAASFGGDATRLALGGDSAGGNLAAAVCLRARDAGYPRICYQLLIYPVLDYYMPGTQSYRDNESEYFLTRKHMVWFWNHYLREDADVDDPYICPLRAADLSGLPEAHILTAEFDPLRDEGEAYAEKLRDFGVTVRLDRCEGLMHGFIMQWHMLDKGLEAIYSISGALKERL
jgi:acetyl esterase